MSTTKENPQTTNIQAQLDALLSHLNIPDVEIDKSKIREPFLKMWERENGDSLSQENQLLTLVALFIYYAHNVLDDYKIRVEAARAPIAAALREWTAPKTNKMVAAEKASENPFKTFVETSSAKFEEVFTWENFMPQQQKLSDKEWSFKLKKCWFAEFFIRFGRTDYIETACHFDKIPADARTEFVKLKLQNLFPKLGNSCQFTYTPTKP